MTKEEFLGKLRARLAILDDKEVDDIIEEYGEHIDEKVKSGTNEEDAIKEFGNLDELSQDILDAYKINSNYNSNAFDNFVKDVVEDCKGIFNKVIKIITHGTASQVVKMLAIIVVICLLLALLKLPFSILYELMDNVFVSFPDGIRNVMETTCDVIVNLLYVVISLILFIKLLKEKLLNNATFKVKGDVVIKEEKTKSSKKKKENEKTEESETIYKNQRTFIDSIADIFVVFFKIFISFMLIPLIMGIVTCSVGIAATILFSIKYILVVGPIIALIGVLLGCIWLTELIFRFIFNKQIPFGKMLIMFISSFILFGIGVGSTFLEVSGYEIVDYPVETSEVFNEVFDGNTYKQYNCYGCDDISTVVDETLFNNEVSVKVIGNEFSDISYDKGTQSINLYDGRNGTRIYNTIIKNLKLGKIYNYDDTLNVKIEVRANSQTIEGITTTKY